MTVASPSTYPVSRARELPVTSTVTPDEWSFAISFSSFCNSLLREPGCPCQSTACIDCAPPVCVQDHPYKDVLNLQEYLAPCRVSFRWPLRRKSSSTSKDPPTLAARKQR